MSISRASNASEGNICRRALLLGGAGALASCASNPPLGPGDATADAALRTTVDGLGADSVSASERVRALRDVSRASLTPEGRILLDAILPGAEAEAALAHFPYGAGGALYAVSPRNGAYRRPNASAADIDAETERLRADAALGVVAPAFLYDQTIAAVTRARTGAAPPADAALGRQIPTLQDLRARAGADPGVWRLPHGESFYAETLAQNYGDMISPPEAYRRATTIVRAVQAEADALLRTQGLSEGSVGERLRILMRDERYLYPDSDVGKAQCVIDMNIHLINARTTFRDAFAAGLASTPAEVRRMSAEDEARGAAGRREGQAYIVDLSHIRSRPKWTLPSVVHHELLPGHLLQGPLGETAHAPRLQARYASGYSEGWAIYAERLMDELGAFDGLPRNRLGYLQWMLFRYGRIIIDIGIHVMRWDRARAIATMREMQGDSIAFITIEDDVDRMCLAPGAYAAQGLTALAIHDLREQTKGRVGARFSLPAFHDAMLRHGPLSPPGMAQAAAVAFSR